MALFRSRTALALTAVGLLVALAVFLFIPFPPDASVDRRLFFSILLGGLAGFGAWSLAGIPALVRDMAGMLRGASKAAPKPVHYKGPLLDLSAHRQKEVRRTVRVMAAHGLFAPEVPDAAMLYAGVAELEESVKPDSILNAMGEVGYYHPGTDPARWMANLLMHGSHAEQDEAAQIADIAALAGDALDVRDVTVRHSPVPGHPRSVQVDVAMTVNGEAVALCYIGDVKYLSTHIHHALATRLRERGSGKRLAALWIADQGVWTSLVPDGAVEALNAALKLEASNRCEWSWLDEGEPIAAGQLFIEQGLR